MNVTNTHYLAWLRDAHAMEGQAVTMLTTMAERLDGYPELQAKVRAHAAESERHQAALETLLQRNATDSSLMKDAMAKVMAMGQAMSGMFATDEVVKGAMAGYTFEHMEIAAYKALIAAAKVVGDIEAVPIYEGILADEENMSDFLLEHMDDTIARFLRQSEAGV